MPSKISILNEGTINQIAAGEVIENAASVVKELVENAIDAVATEIKVITKAGGRGLICVKDNGFGMNEEEMHLAVERHATSKIREVDDLAKLLTLGFRGEALATIAAVSKFTLSSAAADHVGSTLFIEGGKKIKMESTPRQVGTTIEVASLFYNVPARKKFQKSISQDTVEINRVLIELCFSHPEISFEWIHDEKLQFGASKSQDLKTRIQMLLERNYCDDAIEIEHHKQGYHLKGFIGLPHMHRPNRREQYLFVNERTVTSPFFAASILEGFGERLPEGRFPLFILYLNAPPEKIDVNIHPRKKEIKFQEEEIVHSIAVESVRKGLESHFAPQVTPKIVLPALSYSSPQYTPTPVLERALTEEENESEFQFLCTLGDYIFVKREEEIFVVEQRRARERLFFDKMTQDNLAIQHFLFPLNIEMSPSEYRVVVEKIPLLHEIGILLRPFGKSSVAVDGAAAVFDENEIENLLHFLVEEAGETKKEILLKKLSVKLCANLKKKEFSEEESLRIVRALFLAPECHLTPSGKPTFFKITEKEIVKWLT